MHKLQLQKLAVLITKLTCPSAFYHLNDYNLLLTKEEEKTLLCAQAIISHS